MRLFILVLLISFNAWAEKPWIVHEWGTITTQHDQNGVQCGQLNKIDPSEVLPDFVHEFKPPKEQEAASQFQKRPLRPGHPDVTMRLETPVIYFYPPSMQDYQKKLDVTVKFHGGIINEFYPEGDAEVKVDHQRIVRKQSLGMVEGWTGKVLDNYVLSALKWTGVRFNDKGHFQVTKNNVWLAPRKVKAADLFVGEESERYLFYRGVANLKSLLATRLLGDQLSISLNPSGLHWHPKQAMTLPNAWVVDVQSSSKGDSSELGFSELKNLNISTFSKEKIDLDFSKLDNPVSKESFTKLRASMKSVLTTAGLYEDEADAMLNTWTHQYYQKAGRRIFYLVPGDWITNFLPLNVSIPSELTRVLIGRIDLEDC